MSNTNKRVPHEASVQLSGIGQISDVYSFRAGSSIEISATSDGLQTWDGEITLQYLDEVTRTWETMTLDLPIFGAQPVVLTLDLPRVVSAPLGSDVLLRWICTADPSVLGEMSVTATILGYNTDHTLTLSVADGVTDATSVFGVRKFSRLVYAYTGLTGFDGVIQIQRSVTAGATWDVFASFTGEQITGYTLSPPLERDEMYRIACVTAATVGTAELVLSEVVFSERVDPDTLCSEENAQRIAEDTAVAMAEIAEANAKDFAIARDVVVLADADVAAAARDVIVLADADAAAEARDVIVLADADAAAEARDVIVLADADSAAEARDTAAIGAHEAKTATEGHASETVWKDLVGDISKATAGALPPTLTGFMGSVQGYAFSGSARNEVYMMFHVPHDIKPNTRMIPHFHWSPNTNGAGNVEWHFEYTYAKRDGGADDVFPSTTTLTKIAATNSVAKDHIVSEIPDPNQGILVTEPDGLILACVYRDGGAGNATDDTYTGDAFLWTVDLHYQADRQGTPSRDPDYYT